MLTLSSPKGGSWGGKQSNACRRKRILCLLSDILLHLLYRYGQLSGMVEPLAGIFGAFAVVLAEPLLPFSLAFAAGAMVYVVMDDIIPEAQIR